MHLLRPVCCLLAAASAAFAADPPAAPAEEQVALNFLDAEALSVLEFYTRLVGKPFVPQDELKFTVSVVAPGPVDRATALEMLDTAFALKGYSLADHGGFFAVVRRAESAATAVPQLTATTPGDRFATLAIPLARLAPERAAELVRPLISPQGRASGGGGAVVIVDAARNLRAAQALLARLEAADLAPQTRIHRFQYADVAKAFPALQQVFADELRPVGGGAGLLQLIPLPESQQLVAVGSEALQLRVAEAVAGLDTRTRQVLIEVNLVDVSLSQNTSFGLEWQYAENDNGGNSHTVAQDLGKVGTTGLLAGTTGLKYTFLMPNRWKALIQAIQTTTHTEILATPRLVAADGQKASLHVGEEIPVIKESRLDQNNNLVRTFDQKKVGLTTTITPRIAANRDVHLTVSQVVSELTSINEQDFSYRIGERQADTQVLLRDGHTLVIGGLIKASTSKVSSGIPGLADTPFIGWLFGRQTTTPAKSELLIFITPHVIETPEDADRATREERQRARDALETSGDEFRL